MGYNLEVGINYELKFKIMKQYFFLMALTIGISAGCMAQKEEKEGKSITPPQAAKTAFLKTFPGSSNVKWVKEDAKYEAEFKQNGKSMSAEFDDKGTLLETEVTIMKGELPAAVLQYVKEHYKGASIKEAAKITKANGEINYEAEVNKVDVMFDANGKFIKEARD